jgi:hypothetical protein
MINNEISKYYTIWIREHKNDSFIDVARVRQGMKARDKSKNIINDIEIVVWLQVRKRDKCRGWK